MNLSKKDGRDEIARWAVLESVYCMKHKLGCFTFRSASVNLVTACCDHAWDELLLSCVMSEGSRCAAVLLLSLAMWQCHNVVYLVADCFGQAVIMSSV